MDLSPNKLNSSKKPVEEVKEEIKYEPPKPDPNHEQLRDALFFMQDILERCSIPFVVMGTVGKQIDERDDAILSAPHIELGVLRKHYTDSGKSMFWSLLDQNHIIATDEDDNIVVDYKNVPVYIKIIKNSYPFLDNPNSKFYFVENLNLPNPFSEYWSRRKEIE